MNTYIFNTTTTMKEYNYKQWWIDRNIIPDMRITAENLNAAIEQWRETAREKHYIEISNNAIRHKSNMYVDTRSGETKQVGYVITGKTDLETSDCKWVQQYVDLWVEIVTVTDTNFEEEGK